MNAVCTALDAQLATLALRLDARLAPPGSWFDGFWDFVVAHREQIASERAREIHGGGWALLFLGAGADVWVHVFVEARDPRPEAIAPWPVASIVVAGDAAAHMSAVDTDRPYDEHVMAELDRHGFRTRVGYWGVHAQRRFDALTTEGLDDLPRVIELAQALASKALSRRPHNAARED